MSSRAASRRRGGPLVMLAVVLGAWVLLRAAAWSIWPHREQAEADPAWAIHEEAPASGATAAATRRPMAATPPSAIDPTIPLRAQSRPDWRPEPPPVPAAPLPPRPVREVMPAVPPRLAGGHAMLWLAAVAQLPGPVALLEQAGKRPAPLTRPSLAGGPAPHRWSADAWTLVRGGGPVASAAPFAPTYGGSQVGAVLRYRLAPAGGHRPTAYLRATAALSSGGEREVAAGLSLRPAPRVPVTVGGEARVSRIGEATVVRPAVVAVTEFAPVALPAETRAEFYLQGGYVGGRGATPFIDGSVRIDRHVAQVGAVEVRAGTGAWGGAQKGAGRLDLGPTTTLGLDQGRAAARLGLDWRVRVAGDAAPASGPTLTISAGF